MDSRLSAGGNGEEYVDDEKGEDDCRTAYGDRRANGVGRPIVRPHPTLAMRCSSYPIPLIGDVVGIVDEVNLMTFDFYSLYNSELVVPNSPLYSFSKEFVKDDGVAAAD
jgi:hypothetical protein